MKMIPPRPTSCGDYGHRTQPNHVRSEVPAVAAGLAAGVAGPSLTKIALPISRESYHQPAMIHGILTR